jgi:predicted nucleic acid-binding protein
LPAIADSTPLIWLSKIGKISLLEKLYKQVIIPHEVYNEVVTFGLQQGYSDAIVVKDSIKKGWIKVQTLNDTQTERSQMIVEHAEELHLGEVQAIILAQTYNALLLMDESSGRAFAETWGLKVHGTIYVILQGLRKSIQTKEEAMMAIYSLVEKGFRIEPSIILQVLKEIQQY